MIIYWLFMALNVALADPTWKWSNAVKVVDKHEFYKSNEVISKPAGTWQLLFGILYTDSNLKTFKDCIYYRVPGKEPGVLKLKTIPQKHECESFVYKPGNEEWKNLKALQYGLHKNYLTLSMTDEKFRIIRWDVPLFNVFEHPKPKNLMSSAEYRSPRIIFLNPYKGQMKINPKKNQIKNDNKLCHNIAENCEELAASTCMQCPQGWYEVPIGCQENPKFCGSITCGQKNQPACSRGMKYQREEKDFKCREDSSFAYCAEGLEIYCNGHLPYCR